MTEQPKTLGGCATCGRGEYRFEEEVDAFLCTECGAEPRGGRKVAKERKKPVNLDDRREEKPEKPEKREGGPQ